MVANTEYLGAEITRGGFFIEETQKNCCCFSCFFIADNNGV